METTMLLTLFLSEKDFKVTADITFDSSFREKQFSFCINNDISILEIKANNHPVFYEISEKIQPTFRPLLKKITVANKEAIKTITIIYTGAVAYSPENQSCWHNIITRDITSLSWYSSWYPQNTSVKIIHDKVVIPKGDAHFVVKGIWDEARHSWEYGDKGYDPFNIVMYRKEKLNILSNQHMNIFFNDETIRENAEEFMSSYLNVLNFYNGNLFAKKDIPVLDVACVFPAITTGGGYRRKDFMWCTTLGSKKEETAWLNAHETAHIWCSGAKADTWEDWLNETTAEWASLLFALDSENTALFDFIVKPKLQRYSFLPSIQSADGSRPDGVHDKGTVLFYNMYKALGIDAVRKVVRLFSDLEVKTTTSLLSALHADKRNDIAEFIQEGILQK